MPRPSRGVGPGPAWDGVLGPSRRAAWRRRVLRRGIVVVVLCAAGWLTVSARLADAERMRVVVMTQEVAAGTAVTADDVGVAMRPAKDLPSRVLTRPGQVVGRVAAVALEPREVLTPGRVSGPGMLTGLPATDVAVPVPLLDASAISLVAPGDHVDLYPPGAAEPAVRGALVLTTTGAPNPDGLGGTVGAVAGVGPMLVVAATQDEADRLIAARDPAAPVVGYAVSLRPG